MKDPASTLIEQTAIELAAEVYDGFRCMGFTDPRYPNERKYIKKNFERFIPKAIELLLQILHRESTSKVMKDEIYKAIIERNEHKVTINGQDVTKLLEH